VVNRPLPLINVRALSPAAPDGILTAGNIQVPCRFGRAGRSWLKREGDDATPRGIWPMRRVLARRNSWGWLRTGLPLCFMAPDDGWCDAPLDRNYNRPVKLPYQASHEKLWRKDNLYDVVVILGHNESPRIAGFGSAVFFHLADPGGGPTAGCIAVSANNMRKILPLCGPKTRMRVW
jgi:L,D-peptidoglycan transpeptidase YkuD (ErfK/YbiS/YcfS/YnhG family)